MKTIGKLLLGLIILLVVVIAIGTYFVHKNMNTLIQSGIEKYGSEMFQAPVSVAKIDISLADGKGEISGLSLGNPQGFSDSKAFSIDKAVVVLEPKSLASEIIVIRAVDILGAQVLMEQIGINKNNLQTLMDNLDRYSGGSSGAPSGQSAADSAAEPKLTIKQFNFTQAGLALHSDLAGEKELSIPDIRLKDIGSGDGATPGEVASQLIKPILDAAIRQAQQRALEGSLDKALEHEKLQGVKGLLKGLGGSTE